MSIPNPDPGPNDSGGFLISSLPTPTGSVASPTYSGNVVDDAVLPAARGTALRPGSSKYDHAARYVEDALFRISARYARRFARRAEDEGVAEGKESTGEEERGGRRGWGESGDGEERGYASFGDAARDLERVVDVLWVSGTRESASFLVLMFAAFFAFHSLHFPQDLLTSLRVHYSTNQLESEPSNSLSPRPRLGRCLVPPLISLRPVRHLRSFPEARCRLRCAANSIVTGWAHHDDDGEGTLFSFFSILSILSRNRCVYAAS